MKNKWYTAKVIHGNNKGAKFGFPTINLDKVNQLLGLKEGVYAARVKIGGKIYDGALFYGPRLINHESQPVVEIYVFDFQQNIYSQKVKYTLHNYLRPVMDFGSIEELKNQLTLDSQNARTTLSSSIK